MGNNNATYGSISKIFHWATALFILPAITIGLYFSWVDLDTDYGWEQFENYIDWHVGFGFSVLLLMLARIAWRLRNPAPDFPKLMSNRQQTLAHSGHLLLYLLALLTPLTGFLGSNLEGHAVSYFSLLEIPAIFGVYPDLASFMTTAHFYCSWGLVILVSLHLLAVAYHQLYKKDGILRRMW